MITTIVPTSIIKIIENYIQIDTDFCDATTLQKQKLKKILIEIWYFIYTKQIESKKVTNLKFYVDIHSDKLKHFKFKNKKKIYGYAILIDMLVFMNLVTKTKHKTGEHSKGYRIKSSFLENTCFTEFALDFTKIFKNTRNKQHWLDLYPEQNNLIEDCYNTKIELDDYLFWLQQNIGKEIDPKIKNGKVQRRFLDTERIYKHFHLALKINFENLWFKLSNEGRFYTSITNCPSTALDFIKLGNMSLVQLDIKNSQPLLMAALLPKRFKQYKSDVENGVFYQKMGKQMGIKDKDFKIKSFKYIFFSKKQLKSGDVFNALQQVYPGLINEINYIKENVSLAHKLQEMEADIFVKKLGKLNFPKLLRHDEVLVTEQYRQQVEDFLRLEYAKLDLKITIK